MRLWDVHNVWYTTTPRWRPDPAHVPAAAARVERALPSAMVPDMAELSDNGASSSIAKTKAGVIPGITQSNARGGFAVVVLVECAHKMNNAEGIASIHRNSQD